MGAKIKGGCTLWARKTLESDIFYLKTDKWFKIWFYIVGKVNHADTKRFKRGEGFFKYDWIMNACGATKDQVKHCIEYLKASEMIATQKATRGFYITVLKYWLYQDMSVYEGHTVSQTKATQKPHSLNKNGKNGKNEEEDTTVSSSEKWSSIDVKLCNELINRILQNNPKSKVRQMSKKTQTSWLIECRRMRDIDKRTAEEIMMVIIFSQEDPFWRSNILSISKLREKFDMLWLKAQKVYLSGLKDWVREQNKKKEDKEDLY